ncbi:MAG: cytochrome c biogenesis protein CcsA [Spirochaetes bacterium]|jgi:ABC-type uncharacterized transport system permease subunit|nr:cytochrome c biogenesis protein CcsA [Spirochaetota bacterium]
MIFILTLLLFTATSILSIKSLHTEDERTVTATKICFYVSSVVFIILGISKIDFSGNGYFREILFSIWGYFYLLSLILIMIIIYLNFSRWNRHWKSIISLAAPFITILLMISIPFINSGRRFAFDPNQNLAARHMLPVHILINVTSELFFFFSFIGSILYLIMERQLRKKSSMKFIYRLPSLETIESINRWAISRSLALLSAGIITGMIMAFINYRAIALGTAKEAHMYFSWCVILGIFLIRKSMKLPSHKTSIINIILFVFVMFLFIFTNIFITSGFHSFK